MAILKSLTDAEKLLSHGFSFNVSRPFSISLACYTSRILTESMFSIWRSFSIRIRTWILAAATVRILANQRRTWLSFFSLHIATLLHLDTIVFGPDKIMNLFFFTKPSSIPEFSIFKRGFKDVNYKKQVISSRSSRIINK